MKLKFIDFSVFIEIFKSLIEKDFGFKKNVEIARANKNLNAEFAILDAERVKQMMPFIEKDEKGEPIVKDNMYTVIKDKQNEWTVKYNEILLTETEISLPQFTMEELEKVNFNAQYVIIMEDCGLIKDESTSKVIEPDIKPVV